MPRFLKAFPDMKHIKYKESFELKISWSKLSHNDIINFIVNSINYVK